MKADRRIVIFAATIALFSTACATGSRGHQRQPSSPNRPVAAAPAPQQQQPATDPAVQKNFFGYSAPIFDLTAPWWPFQTAPQPRAGDKAYAVFALKNVTNGHSIWVGDENRIRARRTNEFWPYTLCFPYCGAVEYQRLSGYYPTLNEAEQDYCRNRSTKPTIVFWPAKRATVYGRDYWVTEAPDHRCRQSAPPPQQQQKKFGVFLMTNVSGGSVWAGTLQELQQKKTCHFQGGGLCDRSKPVEFRRLSGRYFSSQQEANADYCANRTTQPKKVRLTQGYKAVVYGARYWVTDAPNRSCR
ncbi:hypothetical protein JYT28_00505 [Desulfobulbus sp. AH-315-M07]|nr:hypothetical protein [Desulfobulbus sp. AH-315-M07]